MDSFKPNFQFNFFDLAVPGALPAKLMAFFYGLLHQA
jgi:hypothetical protein